MAEQNNRYTLDDVMIAAPCEVAWESMVGDGRVRHCLSCKLNVYNIKELSAAQAEELINSDAARSGRICMRLYRRSDGTIMTKDCPQGLARIRSATTRTWRYAAAAMLAALTGLSAMAQDSPREATPGKDKECKEQPNGIMGRVKFVPTEKPAPNGTASPTTTVNAGSTKTNQGEHPPHPDLYKETSKVEAGKAHFTAFNLYSQGQRLEHAKEYARAAETYHQALVVMAKHKHDPKFHLKIETALSRCKAKAGIKQ
ncbi:MAG: hypothetical protein JST01_06445 [Cyanobacteria bacterium SZAS TMP-1]|nr:hypothetical protein [Cyanobacteria bacterium SZAS TMP-1]